MSNLGLEHALEKHGGQLVRTAVGDRYVVEEMRKNGYGFGGEQSGHLVFLEHSTTGDGVIAALQVIAMMVRSGRPLSELAANAMQRVPQILRSITLATRKPIEEMENLAKAIALTEKELGRSGRVLVRWSGTEAKLRVMVEGPDESRVASIVSDLIDKAKKDIPAIEAAH
jgi:phosphoglucosamine mutase